MEEKQPLLTITLSDIDAVPVIHYKGKPIDNKIRVSVDWLTNTDRRTNMTYIHIEHVEPDEVHGNTKIIQHNHPLEKVTVYSEGEELQNHYDCEWCHKDKAIHSVKDHRYSKEIKICTGCYISVLQSVASNDAANELRKNI